MINFEAITLGEIIVSIFVSVVGACIWAMLACIVRSLAGGEKYASLTEIFSYFIVSFIYFLSWAVPYFILIRFFLFDMALPRLENLGMAKFDKVMAALSFCVAVGVNLLVIPAGLFRIFKRFDFYSYIFTNLMSSLLVWLSFLFSIDPSSPALLSAYVFALGLVFLVLFFRFLFIQNFY
jgi:hypothetical protein